MAREAEHLVPSEVVDPDGGPLREGVSGGDGQHAGVGGQYGAGGQIGFDDGELGQEQVEFARAQQAEGVGERDLVQQDVTDRRVPLALRGGGEQHEFTGERTAEPDAQRLGQTASRGDRPLDGVPDQLLAGTHVVREAAPDRRQFHAPAGAFEERRAYSPLQLLDGLADPGLRHVQAPRGAAEVQLLGEGQEDLDVSAFHNREVPARRVERIEALGLPDTLARSVDVTDAEAVAGAVREAEARYGPADLIVNNAGVMLLGEVATQPADEWERCSMSMCGGLLHGVRAVLPGMIERGHGTVINVRSVAGRRTYAHHTVYSGGKFAVHGMSESLREEVAGHGVRVVTIAPAAVETECPRTPPTRG